MIFSEVMNKEIESLLHTTILPIVVLMFCTQNKQTTYLILKAIVGGALNWNAQLGFLIGTLNQDA